MDAELDAHGHELDDRHPELDEVRDLLDEPGVRSAPFLHSRARMRGEAFHVELVHDRVRLVARAAVVTFVAPSRPTARGKLRWLSLIDRNAHMGWGKVAEDLKKNGFTTTDKVGEAVRRVTDAQRDLVAKDETDKAEQLGKKTEKVEKMDKPERIGRGDRPERPERPGR